jgi:enoyl-CoA hydratase/carnithine racemase
MTLVVEKKGAVGWIVFNQPQKRNAINGAMWRGIAPAMKQFDADGEVRCVAFRGAGTEAFSAGADISEFQKIRAERKAVSQYDGLLDEVLHAIQDSRKPSLAMIHGFCMGGGLEVALACDRATAAPPRNSDPARSLARLQRRGASARRDRRPGARTRDHPPAGAIRPTRRWRWARVAGFQDAPSRVKWRSLKTLCERAVCDR